MSLFLVKIRTWIFFIIYFFCLLKISQNSGQSLNILKELSPGGELMTGATVQNLQGTPYVPFENEITKITKI
jgi:hypothetical protein